MPNFHGYFIVENTKYYTVFEKFAKSLRKYSEETLTFKDSLKNIQIYFFRLLEGMFFLQTFGVYHLNLTPDNVLISENGDMKIIDFGLCKVSDITTRKHYFQDIEHDYTAPEIFQLLTGGEAQEEEEDLDPYKAEVFSIGMILLDNLHIRRTENITKSQLKKEIKKGITMLEEIKEESSAGWKLMMKNLPKCLEFKVENRTSLTHMIKKYTSLIAKSEPNEIKFPYSKNIILELETRIENLKEAENEKIENEKMEEFKKEDKKSKKKPDADMSEKDELIEKLKAEVELKKENKILKEELRTTKEGKLALQKTTQFQKTLSFSDSSGPEKKKY